MRAKSNEPTILNRIRLLVFVSLLIVAGGYAWLAKSSVSEIFHLWPLVLVGLGLKGLIEARFREGVVLLGIGILFALDRFEILTFWDSWPLALIVAGLFNVISAVERSEGDRETICCAPRERENV